MRRPLDDKFSPVTNGLGFLLVPFEVVVDSIYRWAKGAHPEAELRRLNGALADGLRELVAMIHYPTLLCETKSEWTGVFAAHPSGPHSEIA